MRPEPKKHLSISAAQAPLQPLRDAFAGLSNLPPADASAPPAAQPASPEWKMGRVVLRRETAHRGGKTVVVIDDFATHLPATVLEKVVKKLRATCGCGGTVRDRQIEIQGDQVARIRLFLEKEGFQVAGVR